MTREEAVRQIEWAAEKESWKLYLFWLELEELPPEILKCRHLEWLALGGNKITSIPEGLGQLPHLTTLDLRENQITQVPEAVGQLSHLTEPDLSCNQSTTTTEHT